MPLPSLEGRPNEHSNEFRTQPRILGSLPLGVGSRYQGGHPMSRAQHFLAMAALVVCAGCAISPEGNVTATDLAVGELICEKHGGLVDLELRSINGANRSLRADCARAQVDFYYPGQVGGKR